MVFEDEGCGLFSPLNTIKHTSLLKWGTKSLLQLLSECAKGANLSLWGRDELGEVTKESQGLEYNSAKDSTVLLVNSRAKPGPELGKVLSKSKPFAAIAKHDLVAAKVNLAKIKPGVLGRKSVSQVAKLGERIEFQPEILFQGYWNLVETNGLAIAEQAAPFEDQLGFSESAKLRGPPSNLIVQSSAVIEDYVSIDTRLGPVIVSEGARIEAFSKLSGPCYVGPRARVLSALVRGGTSIFEECKVGGEIENSVLMPHTNKAHFGYVGDTYVGEWVNLGAGSTFSNLKNTYGNVRTTFDGKKVDTGLIKLGPAIGDLAKVSIGALVFAGKKIGTGSHVTGLASEDIPPFTYFDGTQEKMVELLPESVIETQRRMKERRGLTLTRSEEELIWSAHRGSASERRAARVKKGRLG